MRLLDWLKNLGWIKAIRLYPSVKENYDTILDAYVKQTNKQIVLEQDNHQLRIKNGELQDIKQGLLTKISVNDNMGQLCKLIDKEMNERISGRPPVPRYTGGEKMSSMTWHEERILRIDLHSAKNKIEILEARQRKS